MFIKCEDCGHEYLLAFSCKRRHFCPSCHQKQAVGFEDAVPGAVIAVQSFGDFLGINSHLHVIGTDGCFYGNGSFKTCPTPNPKDLEDLFRYEVFKMLKSEGKINDVVIESMMNWPPASL